MGNLNEATAQDFDKKILQNAGKVLVYFWSPSCGPCRMQTPILERLELGDNIHAKIYRLNSDDSPAIAQKYGIVSIPTLILFENGEEIERFIGVQTEGVLRKKLC